jgi:hypothetical protein
MSNSLPAALDWVIAKGMAKNPDQRYRTTTEMAKAALIAITPTTARPQTQTPYNSPQIASATWYPDPRGGGRSYVPTYPSNYKKSNAGEIWFAFWLTALTTLIVAGGVAAAIIIINHTTSGSHKPQHRRGNVQPHRASARSRNSDSYSDLANAISRVTGKPVVYKDVDAEEQREFLSEIGVPEALIQKAIESDRSLASGELEILNGELATLIGRPTTPLLDSVRLVLGG